MVGWHARLSRHAWVLARSLLLLLLLLRKIALVLHGLLGRHVVWRCGNLALWCHALRALDLSV